MWNRKFWRRTGAFYFMIFCGLQIGSDLYTLYKANSGFLGKEAWSLTFKYLMPFLSLALIRLCLPKIWFDFDGNADPSSEHQK